MGYMRHHALVLTSVWPDRLAAAHSKAIDLGCSVSEITAEVVNGYRSFLVAPDGSKEGWDSSEQGWKRRCQLIEWLRAGGFWIDWVEVQFGDEENQARVTRGSDMDAEGIPDTEEVY